MRVGPCPVAYLSKIFDPVALWFVYVTCFCSRGVQNLTFWMEHEADGGGG